jgi:Protein of unknown function (DUF1460)
MTHILKIWIALAIVLSMTNTTIDKNTAIFSQKMNLAVGKTKAETALTVAKSFIDNPYQGHTLERSPEQLVVNLQEFDCVTFVESVVALTEARVQKKPKYSFFFEHLKKLRYRRGIVDGYASRLHYFLEWTIQNPVHGLQNVTKELGGMSIKKDINFMSRHPQYYAELSNKATFDTIVKAEKALSQKEWYFMAKEKVAAIEPQLKDGDVVAITSNLDGLDFNHEGFVIRKGNRAHLLHASSELKKVVISAEPLADYLARVKKHSGIVVMRMQ